MAVIRPAESSNIPAPFRENSHSPARVFAVFLFTGIGGGRTCGMYPSSPCGLRRGKQCTRLRPAGQANGMYKVQCTCLRRGAGKWDVPVYALRAATYVAGYPALRPSAVFGIETFEPWLPPALPDGANLESPSEWLTACAPIGAFPCHAPHTRGLSPPCIFVAVQLSRERWVVPHLWCAMFGSHSDGDSRLAPRGSVGSVPRANVSAESPAAMRRGG